MALQLAFYGVGEAAQPYLDALARCADVALVAVCDPDRRTAERVAVGWQARVHADCAALLATAPLDALWVCVAPHLQSEALLLATARQLPFFVLPPGASDFARAVACAAQVASSGLVTAVGCTSRCTDVVREAREYLGGNPLPLAQGAWLCAHDGDAATLLWNEACRLVDLLRLCCGDGVRVRALAPAGQPGALLAQLELAGGTVAMLSCATFARPEPRRTLELLGAGWSLSLSFAPATLHLDEHDKSTLLRCLNDPAAEQVEAFLQAVTTHQPSPALVSYDDMLRTLAVCAAVEVSLREGRLVSLTELLPTAGSDRGL